MPTQRIALLALCTAAACFGQKPAQIVTGVKLTVDPVFQNYRGACPAMVIFNGSITTNAKGTVKYTFESSTGTNYNQYPLVFTGPGTKNTVQQHWKVSNDFSGWLALKPLPPYNYISSTRSFFKVTCTGHLKQ